MSLNKTGNYVNGLNTILNAFNSTGSSEAIEIFKGLNAETQKWILSSGKLSEVQIGIIKGGMDFKESTDGIRKSISGLTLEEFENAIATGGISASQAAATGTTSSLGLAFQGLAAKIGISTTALGVFMGVAAGVGVVVAGVRMYQQHIENVRKATQEAADTYKDASSSVDDYTSRYAELKQALEDARGNEEETYNVKKQLLELQTELNDKFGEEYGRINLVTEAYNDQTEAIKAYNKEAANSFLNENTEGISRAKREMNRERQYNLGGANNLDNNEAWSELKKIAESYKEKGIEIISDDYDGSLSVQLTADATSATEIIDSFMTDVRNKAKELGDEHLFDGILSMSSSAISDANSVIDDYGEIYRQSLLAEIATDDSLSEGYNKAIDAVEAYNDAVLKSEDPYNDENVAKARENLELIRGELSTEEWKKYGSVVQEVFDEADTSIYDFNKQLESYSNLKILAKDLEGLSELDLRSLNPGENASFDKLKEWAISAGVSVDDLINALIRLGYVQGEVQNTISDSYADNDIFGLKDAKSELTTLGKISESIDKIQNAYKTLSSAIDEYNENGAISIDTLQSVISLGDDWLDYLVDEEGNLKLDEAALQELANARLSNMRIQSLNNVIENISNIQSEADANLYLASTNYSAAESFGVIAQQSAIAAENLLKAKVAAGDISQGSYDKIVSKMYSDIDKINTLFSNVDLGSISLGGGSLGSGSSSNTGSSTSSSSTPSSEEIDWFKYRIEELDAAIELAQTHYDNLTGSSARNTILSSLEDIYITKQADLKQGIEMYTSYAEQELAKIPEEFREAAKNGALGITDFIGDGNDDVVEAIENYRNFSQEVDDLTNEVSELDATIRQLQVDKFNNIAEDYEKLIKLTDDFRDKTQDVIELEENYGNKVGVGFYDTLINQTQQKKELLEEEYKSLSENLQSAISTGKIKLGSDEWKEMRDTIVEVDSELIQCTSDIEDFVNAKLEIKVQEFQEIQDALDGINNSLDTYINLLEEESVTTGSTTLVFTDKALTQLGLLGQQFDLASEKVETYEKRMNEIKTSYDAGELSVTEYREQLMELVDAQNSSAEAMYNSKKAILDLIKNGIDEVCEALDEETEAYKNLIEKKKEALEQDKEESDFQKELAEKTKSVTDIQRQIAALGDANDLESNARRKSLNSQLVDVQSELDEFLADHSYDMQIDALDKESEAYEQANEEKKQSLQDSLNDEETIIANYLQEVVANHETVYTTLQELGLMYGISLETAVTEPWAIGENALGQYAISFGNHSSIFISQLQGVEGKIYNVQTQADNMAYSMINAMGVSSDALVGQVNNVAVALNNDANYAQSLGNMLSNVLSANYNVSGITDSLYSIEAAANAAAGAIAGMLSGNTSNMAHYHAIYSGSGSYSSEDLGYMTKEQAQAIIDRMNKNTSSGHQWVLRAYAKGGLVTKDDDNPLNKIAESVGEDSLIAAQEGEIVLDKRTSNSFMQFADILRKYPQDLTTGAYIPMPKIEIPSIVKDIRPIEINHESNIVIKGNVDDNNLAAIQRQIDLSIEKHDKQLLSKIRYK